MVYHSTAEWIRSAGHAMAGIRLMLRSQRNARIHLAATLAVVSAGVVFGLTIAEWLWVLFAVTLVWIAEGLNTAFELLADAVSPNFHPLIGQAKDVAAGAVLIAAIGAAVIGILVFGPYLLQTVM